MSLTKQFNVDTDKAQNGVPFPVGKPDKYGKTPVFTLARASVSNPRYQAAQDRIMAPHRTAMKGRALPPELFSELTRKVFAEAGTVGWQYVLGEDVYGAEWPAVRDKLRQDRINPAGMSDAECEAQRVSDEYVAYSPALADRLLTRLPELYDVLAEASTSRDLFGDDEADAGN